MRRDGHSFSPSVGRRILETARLKFPNSNLKLALGLGNFGRKTDKVSSNSCPRIGRLLMVKMDKIKSTQRETFSNEGERGWKAR